MRICFDLDFDGSPWPGPLAARDAVAGEVWLGPQGLLKALETALGLTSDAAAASKRVAACAQNAQAMAFDAYTGEAHPDVFWARSVQAAPVATAATLLAWREALVMAGWNGNDLGQRRFKQLAEVTEGLPKGFADRLAAVNAALERRSADVETLHVMTPEAELPLLWRCVLSRLEAHETRVMRQPFEVEGLPADDSRDLARCRAHGFSPRGDGSLQLVRPQGLLEAADELAAWLAAQPGRNDIVLVGRDAVLDAALARYGLPTCGSTAAHAVTQVLGLVLRVGMKPVDPQVMRELLLLGVSPIDDTLRKTLLRALSACPSVLGDDFQRALSQAPEDLRDLLTATQPPETDALGRPLRPRDAAAPVDEGLRETYEVEDACRRVEQVRDWLRDEGADEDSALAGGSAHCDRVLEALAALRDGVTTLPRLLAIAAQAADGVDRVTAFPAQAGLHSVETPGAVAGAAGVVVWWGFTADAAPPVPRLAFTGAERAALHAAGGELPDLRALSRARAARWRRPLHCAREALVLVSPRFSGRDEQFTHPLYDEILARLETPRQRTRLERTRPQLGPAAVRETRELRPLPLERQAWRVAAGRIAPRDRESPSSVETLVACPLQYVFRYVARLGAGGGAPLPEAEQLVGTLAHAMFAEIFGRDARYGTAPENRAPEVVAQAAQTWFEDEAPRRAGALFLPGRERARENARSTLVAAARDFAQLLQETGGVVLETEKWLPTSRHHLGWQGRTDMLVAVNDAVTVVDLKWGSVTRHRDRLASGAACQLAVYAHLAPATGGAYYILQRLRLLASPDAALQHGLPISAPPTAAVYRALEGAFLERRDRLASGDVRAAGIPALDGDAVVRKSALEDGVLRLTAPCEYCEHIVLCGKGGGHV